jgi:hypothetical protein
MIVAKGRSYTLLSKITSDFGCSATRRKDCTERDIIEDEEQDSRRQSSTDTVRPRSTEDWSQISGSGVESKNGASESLFETSFMAYSCQIEREVLRRVYFVPLPSREDHQLANKKQEDMKDWVGTSLYRENSRSEKNARSRRCPHMAGKTGSPCHELFRAKCESGGSKTQQLFR